MVVKNEKDVVLENELLKEYLEALKDKFKKYDEEVKYLLRKTVGLLEEKVLKLETELKALNGRTLNELDSIKSV